MVWYLLPIVSVQLECADSVKKGLKSVFNYCYTLLQQ